MGRNLQHNHSNISIEHSHPGCMWGILHVLKYHHWRHIKKRFHHNKDGTGKHAGVAIPVHNLNTLKADRFSQDNSVGNDNIIVDDKKAHSTPASKGSVKSRIKALISDELSKRKGQHRRCSTYPVRSYLTRTDSIHHLEPLDEDPLDDMRLNDESPRFANDKASSSTRSQDPLVPKSFEEQNHKDLRHNEPDESGTQLIENHPHLQENSDHNIRSLIHTKELNEDASDQQSKQILVALNMINMDKEFFLKILQDPDSPLAHHFHNHQAVSTKTGYSKSVSFPLPGSSYRRGSGSGKLKQKQEEIEPSAQEGKSPPGSQKQKSFEAKTREYMRSKSLPSITAQRRATGILKLNQAVPEIGVNSSSGSSHHMRHNGQNQVVDRSFKDLKHKIKHVIRESKNEKRRITMEAILHKIPHGPSFSEGLKKVSADNMKDNCMIREGKDSPRSSNDGDYSLPSTAKSESSCFRRTLSFSESLDKYSQLHESSFHGEFKHHNHDTLKLRAEDAFSPSISASKSMRRIISLPNLKSYSHRSEDSSDAFASIQDRTNVDGTMTARSDFSEQKSVGHPVDSEYPLQLDTKCQVNGIPDNSESEMHSTIGNQQGTTLVPNIEAHATASLNSDDLGNLKGRDRASDDNQDSQPLSGKINELAGPSTVPMPDFKFQEETTIWPANFSVSEDAEPSLRHLVPSKFDSLERQPAESPGKNLNHDDILQFQVDAKDKAEFDYVKDILELSGFTGNEWLGTWHSDDQPVDPSVIEEMEGCMLLDPQCSGNEEGGNCYHLLLFDLINEVLMEIYANSYTYYPKSLSSLSHIRPMPVGSHVLEEVWSTISWYLTSCPETEHLLDYVVNRDLAKRDRWMNLQFDTECVVLELEDLIFEDLLEEVIYTSC